MTRVSDGHAADPAANHPSSEPQEHFAINNDNRVSASIPTQDQAELLAGIEALHAKLPFLLTLTAKERKELPKMGERSIGFDEKCVAYMGSHPEFQPGFVDMAEVEKDRALRTQMLRFCAALNAFATSVDDTLRVVSSEIWMADLAYYQNVRAAAKRGRPGAQEIFDNLRQRFPGGGRAAAAPATASATPPPAAATPATGSGGTPTTAGTGG